MRQYPFMEIVFYFFHFSYKIRSGHHRLRGLAAGQHQLHFRGENRHQAQQIRLCFAKQRLHVQSYLHSCDDLSDASNQGENFLRFSAAAGRSGLA
jgi:hypothetical protein